MTVEERFLADLKDLGVERGSSVLIGLSGGGDSMALTELISRIKDQHDLLLHAARVTHGIRSEEDEAAEIEMCSAFCRKRHIPFISLVGESGEVADIRNTLGCGPEQAARHFRHIALERLRARLGAEYILLGHTADDRLETILMRVLSGSGPEGLRGIPSSRDRIRRPLSGWMRPELRLLLDDAGIPWAEDSTNAESTYRRNRIRNEVIPLISDVVPGWLKSLETLGERSGEVSRALERLRERDLPMMRDGSSVSWHVEDWERADDYIRASALWTGLNAIDESGIPDRRLPWRMIKDIRRSISKGRTWTGPGILVETSGNRIRLALDGGDTGPYGDEGRFILDERDLEAGFSAKLGRYEIRVEPKALGPENAPLEIRFGGALERPRILSQSITEKSSGVFFHDADNEISYISHKEVKKGPDGE